MDPYQYAKRGAYVGGIIKLALAAGFGAAAYFGSSFALFAVAADSLGDVFSSSAVLIGLVIASTEPDREHPYGRGKAEPVAGTVVSMIIFLGGLAVLYASVTSLITGEGAEVPATFTVYAAAVGVLINEGLYRYQNHISRAVGSVALEADAWNHRADALTGMVALLGVAGAEFAGPDFWFLDPAAGVIIALVILYVAITLFRRSSLELMDTRPPEEQMDQIKSVIESVDGVQQVDVLRARKSGLKIYLDVNVEVDRELTVEEGHSIATEVRERTQREIPEIADVLVHVEPFYPAREKVAHW